MRGRRRALGFAALRIAARPPHRFTTSRHIRRLVIARSEATKQPIAGRRAGLLRFARNDEFKYVLAMHPHPSFTQNWKNEAASARPFTEAHLKGGLPAQKREAERREAHPAMAASCDAARASQTSVRSLRHLICSKARSPFGAPLRRLPERANAPTQPRPRFTRTRGCGRYPHRHSRLSKAPCAPVVMPAGHSSLGANCVHCL